MNYKVLIVSEVINRHPSAKVMNVDKFLSLDIPNQEYIVLLDRYNVSSQQIKAMKNKGIAFNTVLPNYYEQNRFTEITQREMVKRAWSYIMSADELEEYNCKRIISSFND